MGTAIKTARRIIDDGAAHQPKSLATEVSVGIVSITRVGNVATVMTATPHGWSNGNVAYIDGVYPEEFNAVAAISNASGSSFDYTLLRDPGEDAAVGVAVVWRGTLGIELDLSTALGATILGKIRNGAAGPTDGPHILLGRAGASGNVNMIWREISNPGVGNLVGTVIDAEITFPVMFVNVFIYGNTGQPVDAMLEVYEVTSFG